MGARARRESVARGFLADPSPGSESLGAAPGNRWPPLAREFFPTENFGRWARFAGSTKQRPVRSPALEAGYGLHGSVPRALARRGPGTASENHALQNAAGGKEWTV
nr:MAG TPA: hypothetical protein [Caudoviricetes sp.]